MADILFYFLFRTTQQELQPLRTTLQELDAKIREQVGVNKLLKYSRTSTITLFLGVVTLRAQASRAFVIGLGVRMHICMCVCLYQNIFQIGI